MDEVDSTYNKPKTSLDSEHNAMLAPAKLDLHVIGLGHGGSMSLKYIHDKGYKAKYTTINEHRLKNVEGSEIDFIPFVPPRYLFRTRPNGEPVDHSQMDKPLVIPDEVINLFEKGHFYVLLAALGGYTGTLMMEGLSRMLIDRQEKFLGICSIPFSFEGRLRESYAKATVKEFGLYQNFRWFELDDLLDRYKDLRLGEAYTRASEEFCLIFEEYFSSI